jgi:transcriptional regulator with XRE-family HTH domain
MKTFAEHLTRLRTSKGLSKYALAKRAGLTRAGVIELERPGSNPKLSTLRMLAQALGVGVGELVEIEAAKKGKKQ